MTYRQFEPSCEHQAIKKDCPYHKDPDAKPMTEQEIDRLMEDMTDDITCGEIRDRIAAIVKQACDAAIKEFSLNSSTVEYSEALLKETYAKGFADGSIDMRERAVKVCDLWKPEPILSDFGSRQSQTARGIQKDIRALTPGEGAK